MKFKALSIVYPGGEKIARGEKTIEVRSWRPPADLTGDFLIVENHKFLRREGESDPDGRAVAVARVLRVRAYEEADIPAACASSWSPGYYAWELGDVRAVRSDEQVLAARGIYEVDIETCVERRD